MKVTYSRHGDNGFVMHVDGKPTGIFKIRKWMNGLLEAPEIRPTGKSNRFSLTQFQYNGQWE
jgi:hypothetical protein